MGETVTLFALATRCVLAVTSIILNVYVFGIALKCICLNEGKARQAFCFFYSSACIIFSVFELLTLNVNIDDTFNNNYIGLCNVINEENCGLWHGWQIGCYVHCILVIPLLLYFRRVINTTDNIDWKMQTTFGPFLKSYLPWIFIFIFALMIGMFFGIEPCKPAISSPTNPQFQNSAIRLLVAPTTVKLVLKSTGDYGPSFFVMIGLAWGPSYVLTAMTYSKTPKTFPVTTFAAFERHLARVLLCSSMITMLWPITYILYNISFVALGISVVPLDLVLVMFNLVPVLIGAVHVLFLKYGEDYNRGLIKLSDAEENNVDRDLNL